MEVVNEAEAIELCRIHGYTFEKCYLGKNSNKGKLMMLAYKNSQYGLGQYTDEELEKIYDQEIKNTEARDTVIYTELDTGAHLFVADKSNKGGCGTTFNIDLAQRFSNKQAKEKAKHMTLRGKYRWRYWRVK